LPVSEEALRSLLDGRCTIAGFHVPRLLNAPDSATGVGLFSRALRPLLKPGTHNSSAAIGGARV
jgi:hypothetical protein